MADKKTTSDEPTSAVGDTGPDAETVDEQVQQEETAAGRRDRQVERAETLKSVPEGALAPNEKTLRSGETAFRQQWLIDNAYNVLDCPPFEAVGAFHGWDKEYATIAEAQKRIGAYRERVVNVDPLEAVS